MSAKSDALRGLIEKFPLPAWALDAERTIVCVNPVMKAHFGDLTGQKAEAIYDSGGVQPMGEQGKNKGKSTEAVIADVPYRKISGAVDLGDEKRYTIEFFEDISEQKLIQTNMERALAKINAETKMARAVQKNIMPADNTYWNTLAFNSLYAPASDLSGDFYDVLKLNDDEFLIYIADVAGHGIQASLLTVFMRERVRTNTDAALAGPGALLNRLVSDFIALELDGVIYVTMALCKYTKSRHELAIANAGHNCFPLVIRGSGRVEMIPTRGMPVCTLAEDFDYEEEFVSMNPGDRLILFTDGIAESIDSATGRAFGAEGIRGLAERYHEYSGNYLARAIMDEAAKFTLTGAKDDRSIVVVDILS